MSNSQKNFRWYERSGPDGDVVLSTRVRLARNLSQVPFVRRMNAEQKAQVIAQFREAVKAGASDAAGGLSCIEMSACPAAQAASMAERHLISPEFAQCREGTALLLSGDESVSMMINEEDHLRIQVLCAGLDLDGAFAMADRLDTLLDEQVRYAFDDQLGFLTQCPTNLGTGMRASVMLHLPALQESGEIERLAGTVAKLGLTVRGTYGEGTAATGAVYQLSNQVTLGISEQAAIENLRMIARQIIERERAARAQLLRDARAADRVWRSYGVLTTARLLPVEDFIRFWSLARMGAAQKLLPVETGVFNGLMMEAMNGSLEAAAGEPLDGQQLDARRAEWVRRRLGAAE